MSVKYTEVGSECGGKSILIERISRIIGEEQCSFRTDRACVDLGQVTEKNT